MKGSKKKVEKLQGDAIPSYNWGWIACSNSHALAISLIKILYSFLIYDIASQEFLKGWGLNDFNQLGKLPLEWSHTIVIFFY